MGFLFRDRAPSFAQRGLIAPPIRPRAHSLREHVTVGLTFSAGTDRTGDLFPQRRTLVNNRIFGPLRAGFILLVYTLNTLFWTTLLFPVALLKWLVRGGSSTGLFDRLLHCIANSRIAVNNLNMRYLNRVRLDIEGTDSLKPQEWYLVVSNHQSWADILVLQKIFHRRIPLLKFFLKKELIWMPFLGFAWWALDFPFMKRYSKSYLKKHPERAGMDLEITRKACEKFKNIPISVMNFVEGTRFTPKKHREQDSPYRHLLRPKAGGVAMVLAAMGDRMRHILDVTIAYPGENRGFWAFLRGDVTDIKVRVKSLFVGEDLIGDYFSDEVFRERFQNWLGTLWVDKDDLMQKLLGVTRVGPTEG